MPRKQKVHKTQYGINQQAEFNPHADKTDPQEYKSEGLPKMDKYSVDKKK